MLLRNTLLVCLLATLAFSAPTQKVEPKLAKSLQFKNVVNIFVKFQGGNSAALRRAHFFQYASKSQRITHLVDDLKALSESSQGQALSLLRASSSPLSVQFKQIWATNELFIQGADAKIISQLATLPEVEEIREEIIISLDDIEAAGPISPHAEWNLEKVEAPQAWQLPGGNNGQGVIVANIDTGVRGTHEALRNNHRQDHGWFDPYSSSSEANDGNGHGTHTMGSAVGSEVGVAPGAQWIACRGCSQVSCSESALKACGQWVLCPTLADGSSPDCDKAPQIVSNSWGGGGGDTFYDDIIALWKTAGIIPVFAAGNSGPTCGSIGSPGDSRDVIAVGSTTSADNIATSSSAGPTRDNRIKPDISAPGALIRSAWSTGDAAYQTISGTSMATPHVAGAAALLLSRDSNLTYDQVKQLLEENADRNLQNTGRNCGGIPSDQFPNNDYGHGRLNARKALEAAISGGN